MKSHKRDQEMLAEAYSQVISEITHGYIQGALDRSGPLPVNASSEQRNQHAKLNSGIASRIAKDSNSFKVVLNSTDPKKIEPTDIVLTSFDNFEEFNSNIAFKGILKGVEGEKKEFIFNLRPLPGPGGNWLVQPVGDARGGWEIFLRYTNGELAGRNTVFASKQDANKFLALLRQMTQGHVPSEILPTSIKQFSISKGF